MDTRFWCTRRDLLIKDIDISGVIYAPGFGNIHPWYVIHCKTGKEKYAAKILRSNLGLSVYVPEKKIWDKSNVRYVSLFPGYFFVQTDLQRIVLSQINASPGVLRLLIYDGSISSDFVEALSAEIARHNRYGGVPFRSGDTVCMVDGPLRGLEAVFIGPTTPTERVQVLFNILGRLTKTEVERSALAKHTENIQTGNTVGKMRYTRGRMRKIRISGFYSV